jgi:glycosidase
MLTKRSYFNMTRFYFLILLILCSIRFDNLNAQRIKRIDPPSWYTGMLSGKLQLLVYGENISKTRPEVNYPGIRIAEVHYPANPNYLILDLEISKQAAAGKFDIRFLESGKLAANYLYTLSPKRQIQGNVESFSPSDVLYLITPDRFANGEPKNDNLSGLKEQANRNDPSGRHGGDLKGIENHLDYINKLGFTAIWLNPVLENDMKFISYHGYAITDYYKIDPRYGSNFDYQNLITACHRNGLKMIMDAVLNHCGSNNFLFLDPPSIDWFHFTGNFVRSNYRASSILDPHASEIDKKLFSDGWFDKTMPDFNQDIAYLRQYFIQNTLWWIEFAGIDGIRLDTQPYSNQDFLAEWITRIYEEYPGFRLVGESWFEQESYTAQFQANPKINSGFNSKMPSVTDFPFCFALRKALNENDQWGEGISRLYNVIAQDFLYSDASVNMIFLDNHDMTRFAEVIQKDIRKFKMGVSILLTMRGIPQIYYGTELLMNGDERKGHGDIRKDFPGGWPNDTVSAFQGIGLNRSEREATDFLQKILKWRKQTPVIWNGALKQFAPNNGLYVYTRSDPSKTILVMVNNSDKKAIQFNKDNYTEVLAGFKSAREVLTNENYQFDSIKINPKTVLILDLTK